MKKSLIKIAGIAMIGMLLLNYGCKKEETASGPALPPIESFAVNIDDFVSQTKVIDPSYNYNLAVSALTYWNGVLIANLGVPIAVYATALQQTPVQFDEDTWIWSFNKEVLSITYTAELEATVTSDSVFVEMYISQQDGFQDFLWYEGKFDKERTGGEWTIYYSPEFPDDVWLGIEWEIDWDAETFSTKYTVIQESNDYYGSYIEFGLTDDATYNAYYDLYDSFEEVLYTIDYNTTTTAGRICNNSLGCLYWDASHNNYIPPVK